MVEFGATDKRGTRPQSGGHARQARDAPNKRGFRSSGVCPFRSVLLEGGAVLVQSSLKNHQLSSETSQTCVRNARKGAQEFFDRASEIFFKAKNFFFQGRKLFFSGASKTSTKRTHPRGPKPEKRSGHARKSPKTLFFRCLKNECQTDTPQRTETRKAERGTHENRPNFFFTGPNFFFEGP